MIDWEDKSLSISEEENPDFHEHFWPKPELLGLTPDGIADEPKWEEVEPKYKHDKGNSKGFGEHRASLTMKFSTKIYTRLDFRDYPFDHQAIELMVKLLSVRLPGVNTGVRPKVLHPERWRSSEGGHQVLVDADFLPEFRLVRLVGKNYSSAYGAFPLKLSEGSKDGKTYRKELKDNNGSTKYTDQYTLQIVLVVSLTLFFNTGGLLLFLFVLVCILIVFYFLFY